MTNNVVNILSAPGFREADPSQLGIVAGDTVTFVADSGGGATLCLAPQTASILSPSPALNVPIAAGASVTFTFASDQPGVYCCQVMPDNLPSPDSIVCTGSGDGALLVILPGEGPGYDFPPDAPPGN
ncbi:MAG TPA: hypothetical protein VKU19_02125 [Bryobacteraceae bacterium]|nr:hypothetical protein [Bryobacteraceae bacterium]